MVDFSQEPELFQISDRVHLKETPYLRSTKGTVVAIGNTQALSVQVQWDNGDPPEWWNNIALEPLQDENLA